MGRAETASSSGRHHPNYVAVWAVLVALLAVGTLAAYLRHPVLGALLVFGVAALKALLVAVNFMHVTQEPRFVRVVLYGGLALVVIVLLGLMPDIVYVYGD